MELTLSIYENEMNLPFGVAHQVKEFKRIGNIFIVIFDYDDFSMDNVISNMSAFDEEGNIVWTAEFQSGLPTEAWTIIISTEPLIVGNYSGYKAELDLDTGKILNFIETK
jgi:hypothetical protein